MVLRKGLLPASAGMAVGFAGAVLSRRVLAGLLFGVFALDPLTFGGVAVLLGIIAALATYLPGRNAARVDPSASASQQPHAPSA